MKSLSPKRRFIQIFKEKSFGFCTGLVIVLTNLFELTHEPMLCNGLASEGIYNSVAQRPRCRRVGFSELFHRKGVFGTAREIEQERQPPGSSWTLKAKVEIMYTEPINLHFCKSVFQREY